MRELACELDWPEKLWMGVSVESPKVIQRVRDLQAVPAKVRFVSVEPLIAPISRLPLKNIHWVIVGGESGPRARPLEKEWVLDIRDQCLARDIPFFFKQWGGFHKKKNGRRLEGKMWSQMPRKAAMR